MLCLAEDPDAGLPVGAVADGLLNRASDTTRLIDRLERAGLAERLPQPDRSARGARAGDARRASDGSQRSRRSCRRFHRRQWSNLTAAETRELGRLAAKALWAPVPLRLVLERPESDACSAGYLSQQ